MRFVRSSFLLALLAFAVGATTSSAGVATPTGLHGFLLRADEPPTEVFHRTPAFAWNPFPGATGYQFQLSMSSTFRENAIFYNTNTLTTPVASWPGRYGQGEGAVRKNLRFFVGNGLVTLSPWWLTNA